METLDFNAKWIRWNESCLESSMVSVLVNGSPTTEFVPKKGLRQGDPFASFLFLIVVEGLSGVVREAERLGLLKVLKIGRNGVRISVLQFADDTMFICKDNILNIVTIKSILRCFELASRLKVNLFKSSIGGIGVDIDSLQRYATLLNCKIMSIPFTYLGVPIGGNQYKVSFWNGLLDKVKKKLSRWKGRLMSMAGRVTMIKSTLSSMFLFFLWLFKIPKVVNKEFIKIQQRFLWGWETDKK